MAPCTTSHRPVEHTYEATAGVAVRLTFPYYAPADTLPAPLPNVKEMLALDDRLNDASNEVKVSAVPGGHYIAKYGKTLSLREGENMVFVAQTTTVPVPKVYAIFHDEETGVNFIVQEFLTGETLQSAWSKCDRARQFEIEGQVSEHLLSLRRLPSPGYCGGLWKQIPEDRKWQLLSIMSRTIWATKLTAEIFTALLKDADYFKGRLYPCADFEWSKAMMSAAEKASQVNKPLGDLTSHCMWLLIDDWIGEPKYGITFTHGNLSPSNLLLRPDGSVAILGWKYASWNVRCWELCVALARCDKETWFHRFIRNLCHERGSSGRFPMQAGAFLIWYHWTVSGVFPFSHGRKDKASGSLSPTGPVHVLAHDKRSWVRF